MPEGHRPPLRERIPRDPNGPHHGQNGRAEGEPGATTRVLVHQGAPGVAITPAPTRVDNSQFAVDLRWAEQMARSGMLPDPFKHKPENVVWAIGYARDFRIPVMTALNNIYLTREQKPAVMTALMKGLVHRACHKLRVTLINPNGRLDNDTHAIAHLIRSDDPDFTFETVWNIDRAVQAELVRIHEGRLYARSKTNKALPWERYPEGMLKARALSEVIRDGASDVMMGIAAYTPEELGGLVDEEGRPLSRGEDLQGFETDQMDESATEAAFLGEFDGPEVDDHDDPEMDEDDETQPAPGPWEPSSATLDAWKRQIDRAAEAVDRAALRDLWESAGQFRPRDTELLDYFRNTRVEPSAPEGDSGYNNPF